MTDRRRIVGWTAAAYVLRLLTVLSGVAMVVTLEVLFLCCTPSVSVSAATVVLMLLGLLLVLSYIGDLVAFFASTRNDGGTKRFKDGA